MWWPFGSRLGGRAPLPSAPAPPNRPSTVVGFFWDLSMNPKQAATFVFIVGSIIVIASLCFSGACFAIVEASKGIKGIQLRYVLTVGISGASILTLVTTLVTGWLRRLAKAARVDAASADKPNST